MKASNQLRITLVLGDLGVSGALDCTCELDQDNEENAKRLADQLVHKLFDLKWKAEREKKNASVQ